MKSHDQDQDNEVFDSPDHHPTRRIKVLPKEVVDRIAAGEVVQGPSSVAKELIENSLDADSTNIEIQCVAGGFSLLSVLDDGKGIHPDDFELAVTRFATSKLIRFDDLKTIQTFGFRGEALASTSMVSRLTIISKRRLSLSSLGDDALKMQQSNVCAYKMSYKDGKPSTSKPTPIAGNEGTTIKVEDLFYNLPSRRRAFDGARKESDEYNRVLSVAQRYAIHKARDGVGFVCRKKGGHCDLNTSNLALVKKIRELKRRLPVSQNQQSSSEQGSNEIRQHGSNLKSNVPGENPATWNDDNVENFEIAATKEAISHVFGVTLLREILHLKCGEGDVKESTLAAVKAMDEEAIERHTKYTKSSIYTQNSRNGAIHKTSFDGLAESIPMVTYDFGADIVSKTDSENVTSSAVNLYSFSYQAYGFITNGTYCVPKQSSAFILFINDRLVESPTLRRAIESVYADALPKGAKPFIYLSLNLPGPHVDVNVHPTKKEIAFLHYDLLCDALVLATKNVLFSSSTSKTFYTQTLLTDKKALSKDNCENIGPVSSNNLPIIIDQAKPRDLKDVMDVSGSAVDSISTDNARVNLSDEVIPLPCVDDVQNKRKMKSADDSFSSSSNKRPYDPKTLVRTIQQQGSLEPYLKMTGKSDIYAHLPDCEFYSASDRIDMSAPGAFALICRCQLAQGSLNTDAMLASHPLVKPKKIAIAECSLTSVQKLRSDVINRGSESITRKLRESTFVGSISRHRSLIQWGIELLMINHTNLSRELFYQLALTQCSGLTMATLDSGGLNVKILIEQALQFEESATQKLPINKTNSELAIHATECLAKNANFLFEYFSINFQRRSDMDIGLFLTGLPILLDGHRPPAHGIPLFLLRLATEVDWTNELSCFDGICTELGIFYGNGVHCGENEGSSDSDLGPIVKKMIQHELFPAISCLLIPPNDFISNGSIMKVALLSKLYKVFERC